MQYVSRFYTLNKSGRVCPQLSTLTAKIADGVQSLFSLRRGLITSLTILNVCTHACVL